MSNTNGNKPAETAWLTKQETLAQLGISERSLDRRVTQGQIQKQLQARPGRAPEPLYHRGDVERLSAHPAYPLTDQRAIAARPAEARPPAPNALDAFAPLVAALFEIQAQRSAATIPAAPAPQWMGEDGAAEYSGLSSRLIRALVRSGRLPALRDGREWKIRRADLDALLPDSATRATAPKAARR